MPCISRKVLDRLVDADRSFQLDVDDDGSGRHNLPPGWDEDIFADLQPGEEFDYWQLPQSEGGGVDFRWNMTEYHLTAHDWMEFKHNLQFRCPGVVLNPEELEKE